MPVLHLPSGSAPYRETLLVGAVTTRASAQTPEQNKVREALRKFRKANKKLPKEPQTLEEWGLTDAKTDVTSDKSEESGMDQNGP
ncbi:hypothetical protein EJ02DRAFT_427823 [Clathrospora elynae]|uniref:Uncharacterized protein n=1 Tax=Clathrospora elynae TaxID=706981 RepID=A0A6A5S9D8_9PLEO|nr:hypothetical protein EJ02DRAFT_427823 [Clathrospora elynae]